MLAGYEVVKGNDAGSFTGGGRKLVLHTTEGSSANGAIGAYRANNSWPHFTISYKEQRKIQHLETNVASRALQNNMSDGFQTNRANCVQVEIAGFAKNAWTKEEMDWYAQRFLEIRGSFYFPLNFLGSGRLNDKQFVDYSGICGHKNVPDNNHSDPGNQDLAYIISRMGAVPTAPESEVFKVKNFEGAIVKVQTGNNGNGYKDIRLSKDGLMFCGFGWIGSSSKGLAVAVQNLGDSTYRVGVEGAPGAYVISVNVLFGER